VLFRSQFAVRTLVAFDRVTLAAGTSKDVAIHISPRALEYWSTTQNRWIRSGARQIRAGSSSRDLKLSANTP
jgi:beta-glucosidase